MNQKLNPPLYCETCHLLELSVQFWVTKNHLLDQVWVHLHIGDNFLNGFLFVRKRSIEKIVANLQTKTITTTILMTTNSFVLGAWTHCHKPTMYLPKMVSPNLCCKIWGHSVGWRAICKWIQASIPQHRSEQELSKNWTRTEQAHIAERTNNFLSDCSLLFFVLFFLFSPHPGRWFHCQRNSSPPCRSSLCTGSRFEPEQSNIDQHFKLFQKTPVYKRRSSLRGAATFTKVHSRLWGKEGKWSLLI